MKLLFDLFLIVCAVIPPSLFLIYIYFKDKAEKEPLWLLALLFFLGMLTFIPDAIFEIIPEVILGYFLDPSSIVFRILMNFFVIAFVEELFKYIVVFSCTFFSKHFNYRFDGIVYAVFTSLGMAMLENVFYVLQHGFVNAIMRAFLSIPGHAFFAIFMGYYYGLAKQAQIEKKYGKMSYYLFVSLLVPILMHGFYDYCADWGSWLRVLFFFLFVIFMYFAAFIRVHISSKKDEAFVKEQTAFYMTDAQALSVAFVYPDPDRVRTRPVGIPAAPGTPFPGYQTRPQTGQPVPVNGQAGPQAGQPVFANGQARPMPQQPGATQTPPSGRPPVYAGQPAAGQPRPQMPQPQQGRQGQQPGAMQQPGVMQQPGTMQQPGVIQQPGTIQQPGVMQQSAYTGGQAIPQGAQPVQPVEPVMPIMPVDVLTSPVGEGRPPIKLSRRTSAYIFCRGCGTLCRANSFYCHACGTLIHGTGPIRKKS